MVQLSEFIGEMVSELAQARQLSDAASVRLSQIYHADPFLKEMPVPHYTIDEAEVSFPLSIFNVNSGEADTLEKSILSAIKLKLPKILFRSLKSAYTKKEKNALKKEQEETQAKDILSDGTEEQQAPTDEVLVQIDKGLEKQYQQAANTISSRIRESMAKYLATANLNLIKPLDIKDKFMDMLQKEYVAEFSTYDPQKQPVADNDALAAMIRSVGTKIFFEFAKPSAPDGILVEASTGKLNEYDSNSNMMCIKLKVKEQDLDFVVTGEEEDGSPKRFLSLS